MNNNQEFIDSQIIPFLTEKGLIVQNKGDRKPYIMADGRLWALNAMYPNPKLMSVEDTVTHITDTHFVTRTTITLTYIDEDGKECTKIGSGVAAISKKSINEFEKWSPVETSSTSSMGRALKNLGILAEWGATADEISKAKSEAAKGNSSDRVTEMDNGNDSDTSVSDSDAPLVKKRGRRAKTEELNASNSAADDQEGTANMATDKQMLAISNVLGKANITIEEISDLLCLKNGFTQEFVSSIIVDVQGYTRAGMDKDTILDTIVEKWKGNN